jgi:hypothetical protein
MATATNISRRERGVRIILAVILIPLGFSQWILESHFHRSRLLFPIERLYPILTLKGNRPEGLQQKIVERKGEPSRIWETSFEVKS